MKLGNQMLAESKFYMGYSRWVDTDNRYETWKESVGRVMDMHRQKYADVMTPELEQLLVYAEQAYADKLVLGAQRALQFGGEQLFRHEARMYNCCVSYIDRPSFFNEAMYLLLCGCFHQDTLVMTDRGDVRICNLTTSDKIKTYDEGTGEFAFVHPTAVGVTNSASLRKVKLTTSTGEEIVCTEDHEFLTTGGWVKAAELTVDSVIVNCITTVAITKIEYVDDPTQYWDMHVPVTHNFCLTNGMVVHNCGVGFSVQQHHIAKLPQIARRSHKKVKIFQVPDSIEGWADSFGVLFSSYFVNGGGHPEYRGCQVHFDYSKIRPKGAAISGGFKAPGPDGLRNALVRCEDLLENLLKENPITEINSITAYDFVMHMSDAVLSGGVRRCLPEDTLVQIGVDQFKPIADFVVGDTVYIGGQHYNVPSVFSQGVQQVVKIELDDGTYLESTGNHRWYVFNATTDEYEWVEAQHLQSHHAMVEPDDESVALLSMIKAVGMRFVKKVEASRNGATYDIEVDSEDHAFIAKHHSGAIGVSHNSATICIFDKDDAAMLKAKTGDWFIDNPQRARSNNSALLIREDLTRNEWAEIMKSVKDFGEPGFIFSDNKEFLFNPCISGDALVTVSDHGVDGGLGVQYKIPMKMLVELVQTSNLPPCALSYNATTGEHEWRRITAGALTKTAAEMVKVEYNGKVLKCTPDHLILTKRGWIEAQHLVETDELVTY